MTVGAAVKGQLRLAGSLAWNPVPIPSSLQVPEEPDVALCVFTDAQSATVQYAALRHAAAAACFATAPEEVYVDQVLLQAQSRGVGPKEVKWTRQSVAAEPAKHPLGVISYAYRVTDQPSSVTQIAFYDAYAVIGTLAAQLIKQPGVTKLPMSCSATHGFLGAVALPEALVAAGVVVTTWMPDGRWSSLIAVGCSNGAVLFADLKQLNAAEPLVLDDSPAASLQLNQGPVLCMSWHHQALSKDILLVGCAAGFAVVHTKNFKILIAPSDSHRRKNVSGVCWLENGNSVAVTYNDDDEAQTSGVLQLWDLRRSTHPYKEIASHHQAGVLGLMKSAIDPRFFTTVSKDGRVVTWATFGSNAVPYSDVALGEPLMAFALLPCLGLVTCFGADDAYIVSLDAALVPSSLKFSPYWIQANNALTFGFGGKLAYLHTLISASTGQLQVSGGICNLPADDTFVESVAVFVRYLSGNDLAGYCHMRSAECTTQGDPFEADVWSLLGAAFANPPERIPILLNVLGHNPAEIQRNAQVALGHTPGAGVIGGAPGSAQLNSSLASAGIAEDSPTEHEAASFFDKLACSNTDLADSNASGAKSVKPDPSVTEGVKNGYVVDRDWSSGPLKMLKELFLIGQPLGAIECAIQANDFGLAFMIACSLDNKMVMQTVKEKFVEFNRQSFVGVVAQSSEDNFESIVANCADTSAEWKDIAAILVTYPLMQEVSTKGTMTEFNRLCTALARRLDEDGDLMSAIPCYLVAGAYSEASKLISSVPATGGSQALKILVLRCLINQSGMSLEEDYQSAQTLQHFLTRLVNAGHLEEALTLISLIGNDVPGTAELRNLIAETRGSDSGMIPQALYEIQPAPAYLMAIHQQQASTAVTPQALPQTHAMQPAMMQATSMQQPAPPQQLQMTRQPMRTQVPTMATMMPAPPPPVSQVAAAAPSPMVPNMIPGMPQMQPKAQMIPPLPGSAGVMNSQASSGSNPPVGLGQFNQSNTAFGAPKAVGLIPGMPMRQQPPMQGGVPPPPSVPSVGSPALQPAGFQKPGGVPSFPNFPRPPGSTNEASAQQHRMTPTLAHMMAPPMPGMVPPPPAAPGSAFNMASLNNIPAADDWQKSTHPAACVSHIQPGMPTPWPLPTPTQGGRTTASEKLNQQIHEATAAPSGTVCPPQELAKIRTAIDNAMAKITDASKQVGLRPAVQELYKQLGDVAVNQETITQLSQLADALNSGNLSLAMHLAHVMISTSWNKNTKNWLSALKKLASPNTYAAPGGAAAVQATF